jgi:hypothetical protein
VNDDEHKATHAIDRGCCQIGEICTAMIDAAYAIGGHVELKAIMDAAGKLHDVAKRVHYGMTVQ